MFAFNFSTFYSTFELPAQNSQNTCICFGKLFLQHALLLSYYSQSYRTYEAHIKAQKKVNWIQHWLQQMSITCVRASEQYVKAHQTYQILHHSFACKMLALLLICYKRSLPQPSILLKKVCCYLKFYLLTKRNAMLQNFYHYSQHRRRGSYDKTNFCSIVPNGCFEQTFTYLSYLCSA